MVTFARRPRSELAAFVQLLWYVDEPMPPGLERSLPTGGMQLVVNLGEDQLRWYDGDRLDCVHTTAGAALVGPGAAPVGIDTAEQRRCVGVSFRPGGAAPFLVQPAVEVAAPLVGLDDLWGRPGAELRERLLHASTPAGTLATLERCLLDQVVRPLRPEPALGAALHALEQGRPVREVVEHVGTTPASLGRMFRRLVGLSPKPYARVRRLQRVLVTASAPTVDGRVLDWAAIAVEHGYFDQAHLINDFRALTGTTPTAYRPRSTDARNHLPVPG